MCFEILVDTLASIMNEEKNTHGFESDMAELRTKCKGAYLALAMIISRCPSQKGQMSDKCREIAMKIYEDFRHNDLVLTAKMKLALEKHLNAEV